MRRTNVSLDKNQIEELDRDLQAITESAAIMADDAAPFDRGRDERARHISRLWAL